MTLAHLVPFHVHETPALALLLGTGFTVLPSELPHWLKQRSQLRVFDAP
jgi:hypothetical protein